MGSKHSDFIKCTFCDNVYGSICAQTAHERKKHAQMYEEKKQLKKVGMSQEAIVEQFSKEGKIKQRKRDNKHQTKITTQRERL